MWSQNWGVLERLKKSSMGFRWTIYNYYDNCDYCVDKDYNHSINILDTKRGPNFKFEEQWIKILNSGATEEVAGR